jgi:hypothetical protein
LTLLFLFANYPLVHTENCPLAPEINLHHFGCRMKNHTPHHPPDSRELRSWTIAPLFGHAIGSFKLVDDIDLDISGNSFFP